MKNTKRTILISLVLCPFMLCGCEKINGQVPSQNEVLVADDLSNSCVTCFAEDAGGFLWIGTERGLNRYSGNEYTQYFHSSSKESLLSNKITSLYVSHDAQLWVGTSTGINSLQEDGSFRKYQISSTSKVIGEIFEHDGDIYTTTLGNLLKLNRETGTFEVVVNIQNVPTILCCSIDNLSIDLCYSNHICRYSTDGKTVLEDIELEGTVNDAYFDGDRFVYLATTRGLAIYDSRRNIIEYTSDFKTNLETVAYYDENCVILSTDSRLFLFDNISHCLTPLQVQSSSDFNISSCFVDSNENLWIGFNNNGLQVLYKYDRDFYEKNGIQRSGLNGKNVTSIEKDNHGRIWVAVDHNRLFVLENDELTEIELSQAFGFHLTKQQSITNIFAGSDDLVYLCINFVMVRCSYEKSKFKVIDYRSLWRDIRSLSFGSMNTSDYVVNSTLLAESENKSLWIGSVDGSFRNLSKWDSEMESISIKQAEMTHMGDMLKLSDGRILGGFYSRDLQIIDPEKKEICQTIPLSEHLSTNFFLTALCEDNEGGIWVGTRAEGVFHVSPDYTTITRIEGIPCDDICSILCDAHGDIWISTYDGLSRYWFENGSVTTYYKEDGIGGNQFNYKSAEILSDGTLLFGGTHGLTIINPNEEEHRQVLVPFHFDNLFVNNALVVPYMSDIIDSRLSSSPTVRLGPNNRQISVTFSAIDFGNQNHIRYLYSLDNANNWTRVRSGAASFSKFPHGKHVLHAKIESTDNPNINQIIDLKIYAKRPAFISILAIVIYCLAALIIASMFAFLGIRLYQTKLEQQSQQLTNKMNMRFFANISHEFRTPLTMVNGAIKQLDAQDLSNGERRKLYGIINRNANRMISLVSQLMDFGKLDEDVLALNVRKDDALAIINRIVDDYRFTASLQEQTIKFRSGEEMIPMWLDEDKLEKIFYNILSNAIKFTPPHYGVIAIDIDLVPRSEAERYFDLTDMDVDNKYLFVSVFNSGSSIPEDKLELIFERYAQLEQGAKVGGTGIGLYYTKRLVEIHHGHIKASNKRNDQDPARSGVVITFILPVNDIAYRETEKSSTVLQDRGFVLSENNDKEVKATNSADNEKALLLVIDDDVEVVYYLTNLLSPSFRVISAQNAEDGYKEMGQQNPDLVLCDILMPQTDGLELCRKVKSDLALCHIPFILLTAKFNIEDQIAGLNCGANAYVLKPFDPDYLIAILNSQLSNRDKLRSALMHNTDSAKVEESVKNGLDKQFIEALYILMEQSISKPDMDVTEMARAMNVSRSQLYYKVKALTGETPHAFFNRYKLNIAAKWIVEDKYKISAIAQDLGFASASHFTTIFRKEFGCLPSDYKAIYMKK